MLGGGSQDEVLVFSARGHDREASSLHVLDLRDIRHDIRGMTVGVEYTEMPREGAIVVAACWCHILAVGSALKTVL